MKSIKRSKLVNINNMQALKKTDNNIINSYASSPKNPINASIHYKKLYDYSELLIKALSLY